MVGSGVPFIGREREREGRERGGAPQLAIIMAVMVATAICSGKGGEMKKGEGKVTMETPQCTLNSSQSGGGAAEGERPQEGERPGEHAQARLERRARLEVGDGPN